MTTEPKVVKCTRCDAVVEVCAVCERDVCGDAVCYRCLRIEVRQAIRQPHIHGG